MKRQYIQHAPTMRNSYRVLDLTTKLQDETVDETGSAVLDGATCEIEAQQHQKEVEPQRKVEATEQDGNKRQPNDEDQAEVDNAAYRHQFTHTVAGFCFWSHQVNTFAKVEEQAVVGTWLAVPPLCSYFDETESRSRT